ncbi:MAG: prepilin peptidase [Deltaproteobacteria bacterium]|nr:prepilin peptidase [Deltaproteobacteria bacterium]
MSIFIFVLGLIFGSFANVIIYRLPRDQSIVRPRSNCIHCKKQISFFDNVPLLSFVLLMGKCRHCHGKISIRYPIVEFLVGFVFLAVYKHVGFGFSLFFRDLPFVLILIIIAFIDVEHRIIPDELSLGGLVLGLVTSFLNPELGIVSSFIGAGFGFCVFYGLAWCYFKITQQSGLGGGDIKLLAMLGAFLGFHGIIIILMLSSISGSIIGILWALWNKEKNLLKTAIPFGPFLVVSGLFYYLIGNPLWLQFMIPI